MNEIDRISALPDYLIHDILSLLKTKQSVRTTVLNKKWMNVWKSVSHLDLDASDFSEEADFPKFVDSILHHKVYPEPQQLDTFNLTWHDYFQGSHLIMKIWFSNLVYLKPRVVSVDISNSFIRSNSFNGDMSFLSSLFQCGTFGSLVLRLGLYNTAMFRFNLKVVNLPCLKSLKFGQMSFTNEFIHRILLGCPIVEELAFEFCFLGITPKFVSSTVKKLEISRCTFTGNSILRISMPNLEYLSCDVSSCRALFENLSSLRYASVDVSRVEKKGDGKGRYFSLRSLSNVKILRLSGFSIQSMLDMETLDLPIFEKLERLELDAFVIHNFKPITSFLWHAPNLKGLTLQNISMIQGKRVWKWDGFHEVECGSLKTDNDVQDFVKKLKVRLSSSVSCQTAPLGDSLSGNDLMMIIRLIPH